jgi:hypothetical protein
MQFPQPHHLTSTFFIVGVDLGESSITGLAAGGRYDESDLKSSKRFKF